MATVFTRIINGELPGRFVWRDDLCAAFLSINPLKPGHTLVVPREEVDHWIDLDLGTWEHPNRVAKAIGTALDRAYAPEKVGLMLAGLEVPHVHIHVVPIWGVHDLDFSNAEQDPDPDSLDRAAYVRTWRSGGADCG
jgi:histidine triad (HIT) family protein